MKETRVYNDDCVEGSKKHLVDKSVDLIICDPPFGINESSFDKHYNREDENVIGGYVEAPNDYYNFTVSWLEQAKRVLKDTGSMYIISGWSKLKDVLTAIEKVDLHVINHIIWKYNFGVYTTKKFVSSHYHILYVKKEEKSKVYFNKDCRFNHEEKNMHGRSLQYNDMEDVWIINKEYLPKELKNQNKLPNELVKKMIQYSSKENDVVCDFFLGNFTTAFMAKELKRMPYGFEMNKESYDYFYQKLMESKT